MATTLEELQIKFTAEMGGLNTQLNGVKQAVTGIEAPTGKASGALGNLAKMGKIIGGAAIGAKLISVGKEAIQMANDAVESEQLFEVSMGGMADSSRQWSEELSKSLGLNAVEVRKSVGTFNVMFNSMGFGETQARDMSQSMTELAQDMASFYNLDPTEAFQKLSAGITGEALPLKRLGILIDENTISQYAMKKGISTTGKEMTQQQKILARYGAIMEQTKKAQGDLARTMESPTNQLRRMSAQVDAAKIALGTALQPALLAVLPALTSLAVGAGNVINALTGMGKTTGLQDVLITLDEARAMAAEVVGTGFADIAKNIDTASKNTSEAIATFETAEFATKKVFLAIDFDPPTVSNYQLVTEKMAALKTDILALEGTVEKYIITYLKPLLMEGSITQATYDKRVASLQRQLDTLKTNADKLESKVTAKIAAAMEDQNVTLPEKLAILDAIRKQVNDATTNITVTGKKMKAQIAADLKAKKISEDEAAAAVLLVNAEMDEALTNLTASSDALTASVGIGNWNDITLSQTQSDELAKKITAGIEASNVVVKATIDEVQAEFTGTGKIGLAVGTLYNDIGEKITAQNEIIAGLIDGWADGLGQPPTAEEVAAVQKEVAKRDKLLAMIDPKLGVSGAMTMNIGDLTLDSTSIKNYLAAINEAFESETTSAATNFEAQKVRLANAFGMPEWDSVLATYGLFGLDYAGAVEELRKQMADALAEEKNAAIIKGAAKLLPDIAAAIASGDSEALGTAASAVISFISGMGEDLSGLSVEARTQALAMVNAFDISSLPGYLKRTMAEMLIQVGASSPEFIATFGDSAGAAMKTFEDALVKGTLTQDDFNSIIGASSSKEALAALAVTMATEGNTATAKLIQGLLQQRFGLAEAARLLREAATPKPADTFPLGADAGQGLINGMDSKIAAIKRKAQELAKAAIDPMYITTESESPSKVTTRLGEYVGEGLAIGMTDTTRMVSNAASALAMGATNALTGITASTPSLPTPNLSGSESAISRAVEQVMGRLNIELVVDGERLGRASIKAINSVQQRSGRTILSVT